MPPKRRTTKTNPVSMEDVRAEPPPTFIQRVGRTAKSWALPVAGTSLGIAALGLISKEAVSQGYISKDGVDHILDGAKGGVLSTGNAVAQLGREWVLDPVNNAILDMNNRALSGFTAQDEAIAATQSVVNQLVYQQERLQNELAEAMQNNNMILAGQLQARDTQIQQALMENRAIAQQSGQAAQVNNTLDTQEIALQPADYGPMLDIDGPEIMETVSIPSVAVPKPKNKPKRKKNQKSEHESKPNKKKKKSNNMLDDFNDVLLSIFDQP